MGRVFSGVQPTGNLHLGNYLGAIRNWVDMQALHDCMFCVVDLHALTVEPDPAQLKKHTREVTAAYVASGIDPEHSIIFVQSHVLGHAQLAWLLSCLTPLGWLNRMTQFKEKAGEARESALLGLYAYPVLMAADILLYKATHVPVGEDQKQHLELARDVAGAFNRRYGAEVFPLPEPVILGSAARVMSLRDGRAKMSKSDASDYSRLNLTDSEELIEKKIRKAKSDSEMGLTYEPETRPEAANLLSIYAALEGFRLEDALARFREASFSEFKGALATLAVAKLGPIGHRMRELLAHPDYIDDLLRRGAQRARAIADEHLAEIERVMGLLKL